jgi:hypothetical protein
VTSPELDESAMSTEKKPEPSVAQLRSYRRALLIWAGIFVGLTLLLSALALRQMDMAFDSASWPLVEGVITSSERVSHHTGHPGDTYFRYRAAISYSYRVDGREYRGDQLRFASEQPAVHATGRLLARYPEGRQVMVAHHPERHGLSVLEPGVTLTGVLMTLWSIGLILLFPIGLALLCLLGAIYWHRKLRRARPQAHPTP